MIKIFPISAFNDNYIWVILHLEKAHAVIIDPGEAAPVLNIFHENNLTLSAILITHHHYDHTGGVKALSKQENIPVYGSASNKLVSHPVKEGEQFIIDAIDTAFRVLEIPGHTLDHLAYVTGGALFCGDTLFTAGCGRVFEGTHAQMFHSLEKLAELPPDTQVYCGHEYTLANLQFAQAVEPENKIIQQRLEMTKLSRLANKPTIPAPLSIELETNPFLRCRKNSVQNAANEHFHQNLTDPIDIFTKIRSWKDQF